MAGTKRGHWIFFPFGIINLTKAFEHGDRPWSKFRIFQLVTGVLLLVVGCLVVWQVRKGSAKAASATPDLPQAPRDPA